MERRSNRRGYPENFVKGRHLQMQDLKGEAQRINLPNNYIYKENIPAFPRPEFHVSRLKHDTDVTGLSGIRTDSGFKDPGEGFLVWWSLVVGPDEIKSAERRLLEKTYPDRTEEQAQMSFLEKFATSPAFSTTSMMGSFRFTFHLDEVLKAYSEQFCSGAQPVMRVFETVLYKQEVMYVVLVHSPADQEKFSEYPLLTDDPESICTFRDGCFIWRSEAMCETHRYELVHRPDEMQMEAQEVSCPQFYAWDNVVVALHVDQQVLKFDVDRLRENLKFCRNGEVALNRNSPFLKLPEAESEVKSLWPDYPSPLEH